MNKHKLIVEQILKINKHKITSRYNKRLIKKIRNKFIGIGQPLNDNILKFNKEQMLWAHEVLAMIDDLQP